ncbi:MAG: NAD(P)-dependent oxidoreductase [Lautropia sp.]
MTQHDSGPPPDAGQAEQTDHTGQSGRTGLAIGFVGLGVMGQPMARHLHAAGHVLHLHDLRADAATRFAESLGERVRVVPNLRELAACSEIVITMLPDGRIVQQVCLGDDGLEPGLRPGSLLLDTSSSEPWLTRETAARLAARGVAMVDAAVSGAQWGAEEASLVFMAGGEADDLARVRPLLDRMGRTVVHLGPIGAGHQMKCINNLITAVTFGATAEGLAIGKASGLDPNAMLQVLNASTGGSWVSRTHFEQRILSRRFDDPFKLALMLKDMGIATALAREQHVPVPLSGLALQLWQAADRAAGPGASVSEWVRWVERQAGVELSPGRRDPDAPLQARPGTA